MVDKSEKFSLLVRLGYAVRGVVYILLGYLALSTARAAKDAQNAVFDLLQDVPGGAVMLILIALGLLAYGAYRLIDAVTNIERHDSDTKGRAERAGALASGVAHLVLAFSAWQFASGSRQRASDGSSTQEQAVGLLDWELGPVILGIAGLGFVAAAAAQTKDAYSAGFMKGVGSSAPGYVKPVGRAGYAARAVVFLLIGWSLIKSAWFVQAGEVKGLGDAIVALSGSGLLYTLVAIGLLLFGVFSLVTARYRIIPDIQKGDLKPTI